MTSVFYLQHKWRLVAGSFPRLRRDQFLASGLLGARRDTPISLVSFKVSRELSRMRQRNWLLASSPFLFGGAEWVFLVTWALPLFARRTSGFARVPPNVPAKLPPDILFYSAYSLSAPSLFRFLLRGFKKGGGCLKRCPSCAKLPRPCARHVRTQISSPGRYARRGRTHFEVNPFLPRGRHYALAHTCALC